MRGYLAEGLERLELALAMPTDRPESRADALNAAAGVTYWRPTRSARAYYEEEIEARPRWAIARARRCPLRHLLHVVRSGPANPDTSRQLARRTIAALEIYRELGDDAGIGRCEWALANTLYGSGKADEARARPPRARAVRARRRLHDRMVDLHRRLGASGGIQAAEGGSRSARTRLRHRFGRR